MNTNDLDLNNPIYLDPTTRIYNRAAYAVFMPRILSDADKIRQPLTISLLDVDNFEAYNEAYGRNAGNEKLNELIAKLKDGVKESDFLFRYGGDELFLVFKNRVPNDVTGAIIPRIRAIVNAVGLDASIGTTGMQEGDDTEEIFNRVEKIMREEKDNKKNLKNG